MMSRFVWLAAAAVSALLVAGCGAGAAKPLGSSASSPAAAVNAPATIAATATVAAQVATPATNPAARETGPVKSIDGSTVTLQDGTTFTLNPQTNITRRVTGVPTDVQKGRYVAVTAKRQPDNTLLASEVVIFDSASASFYRQFPMDGGNIMTNAAVDQVNGNSFNVTFPGGAERVTLAPDAKLSQIVKGSATDIKVGDTVSASVNGDVAQSVIIQ
jgi:hypothetical protein